MSRTSNDTKITLTGTKSAETAKAVLFIVQKISGEKVTLENPKQWFPFSQVTRMTTDPSCAGNDQLVVSQWICKEKGLLDAASLQEKKDPKKDINGFDEAPWLDPRSDEDGDAPF